MDTDDHPLKVFLPRGGRFLAMHWWTYNDRGHLALAPTEAKLRALAARVFDEHSGVEVKDVCEIEVVAPSRQLRLLSVEHFMRENVSRFHHDVVYRMREVMKAGKPLPAPFAPCEEYALNEGEEIPEREDDDAREFRLDHHYDCANCTERVRLVGMTPRELFAKFHKRWEQAHPQRGRSYAPPKGTPQRGISTAPEAVDGEPLWYALANFGHHSGGLELHAINYEELTENYRPQCLRDDVMFYFRRLRGLNELHAELAEARAASDAAWEAEKARSERARITQRDREEVEDIERTIACFTEVT